MDISNRNSIIIGYAKTSSAINILINFCSIEKILYVIGPRVWQKTFLMKDFSLIIPNFRYICPLLGKVFSRNVHVLTSNENNDSY